jgi:hypothetical protein
MTDSSMIKHESNATPPYEWKLITNTSRGGAVPRFYCASIFGIVLVLVLLSSFISCDVSM